MQVLFRLAHLIHSISGIRSKGSLVNACFQLASKTVRFF
jgi:hypothetical protein